MRLVQFLSEAGERCVALVSDDGSKLQILADTLSTRQLALDAHNSDISLSGLVSKRLSAKTEDYAAVIAANRILLPLDHPDPAHLYITGTGLDHLGSAQARDSMHT